jgi:tetratricopeptide (TPR) repeat protein
MSISVPSGISEAPPIVEQSDKSLRMEDLDTLALGPESIGFDIWSAVDVPGSPGLTRLFSALEIKCSVPVPPLSLDTGIPEESQYISDTEMQDLWNEDNKSRLYELDVSYSPRQLGNIQASPEGGVRELPRDPKLTLCEWRESPLNEIYIFQTSPTKALYQPPSSRKPLWAWLEAQEADLRIKLSKLKPPLHVKPPLVIAMMKKLAEIYIRQGRYQKAEKLCRCVVNVMRESLGFSNLKTVVAWQKWIRSLLYQGQYLHARTLLSKMYSKILGLVNPDHNIATEATFLMAWTALNLNYDEEAERLLRQVLQIRLNTEGPRSHGTRICMDYLGYVLGKQRKHSEAEKLFRAAMHLHHEFAELGEEEDLCNATNDLSWTLNRQGLHKESEDVARLAVERLEGSLGPKQPRILKAHVRLARSLAAQGQYIESGKEFRTVFKKQSKLLGESHPATLTTAWELALSLEEMGHLEEATKWYEKTFWGDFGVHGPDGKNTVCSCNGLGLCYEKQGRYRDAMKLYRELVERIQAVKGNDHPAIAEVQGWIEGIQKRPLEGEEYMTEEDTATLSEGDDEDMTDEDTATLSEGDDEDMTEEETDNLSEEGDEDMREEADEDH